MKYNPPIIYTWIPFTVPQKQKIKMYWLNAVKLVKLQKKKNDHELRSRSTGENSGSTWETDWSELSEQGLWWVVQGFSPQMKVDKGSLWLD